MDAFETLRARGFVQQCTGEEALAAAFKTEQVSFYVGFDPTGDSLHVGHLMPVMAMAWLQRAGHRPVAVVGGGTAMVGDPSGKSELRQMLTLEQIEENSRNYREQLSRILTIDGENGLLMINNADWLLELNYIQFLREIGKLFSVNRMLAAEAYKQRLKSGLSFIEFNYQILQAYDFLELYRRHGVTLQLGGDDQWGNILAGTDLIRRVESGRDAFGLTTPLITTASGAKMGKTAKGAVWLDATRCTPFDYYQYWLNVDDADVVRFLKLYTFLPLAEIADLERLQGADIRQAKRVLARESTTLIHGQQAMEQAEAAAKAMVAGAASSDMPTFTVDLQGDCRLIAILAAAGMNKSASEGRRLIKGGGVKFDGEKVISHDFEVTAELLAGDGAVVRIGKKRALRLLLS